NSGYTAAPIATTGGSTLTAPSLTRTGTATVNFVGGTNNLSPIGFAAGTGINRLTINGTTGPTLANSILPYATVNGTDWASYTSGNSSIVNLTVYTNVSAPGALTGTGVENVNLSAAVTVSGTVTINSLNIGAGASVTINAGGNLVINNVAGFGGGILT